MCVGSGNTLSQFLMTGSEMGTYQSHSGTGGLFKNYILLIYLAERAEHTCHAVLVEVRGRLSAASSRLPPRTSLGLNPGQRAEQQALLPTKPPCQTTADL